MAKNQNSAEKRRREVEKKFKAEEKRKDRLKRKALGPSPPVDQPSEERREPVE